MVLGRMADRETQNSYHFLDQGRAALIDMLSSFYSFPSIFYKDEMQENSL